MRPDLDSWLPKASLRVSHRRESFASADALWASASAIRLSEARVLGRLVRLRIPGVPAHTSFDELFRTPPFTVLTEHDGALVSGLVGKIWTPRRDYPALEDPEDFRRWSAPGTVRVLFANWVEDAGPERAALVSESRVAAVDVQGRIGLAAVRPLIAASHHLIASEGIDAAVRRAESGLS
jgi:hypothetical protein